MSGVQPAQQRLQAHWQVLRQQWQATCALWRDQARHSFNRQFWKEWERTVPTALRAMEELDQVLSQARRSVR